MRQPIDNDEEESIREKLTDWLPVVLILGGLGLSKLEIAGGDIAMNAGFLAYGVLGLIDSFKRKYHVGFSWKYLKIAAQLAVTVLALKSFMLGGAMWYVLALLLLDKLILTPGRLESGEEQRQ
ncbi:MAG: hypothetical protein HC859_05365 [Bacteroidia bacterium]|nr:hypothetical protein [Bacteroidia bacterium]